MEILELIKSMWLRATKPHIFQLREREDLTIHQIWDRFYSTSGLPKDDVLGLWIEVSQILRLPEGKMRPEDILATDLSHQLVTDSPLLEELQDRFSERSCFLSENERPKIEDVATLDDYIRAFARKKK